MILAFSTKIKGNPTYFVEKITSSLHFDLKIGKELNEFILLSFQKLNYKTKNGFINKVLDVKRRSKKHAIREDKKDRWKADNDIHFSINVRTKNQFQFAPVVKVKSIQRIEIYKVANVYTPYTYKTISNKTYQIAIDGICLNADKIEQFAINDGFDDADDFFEYFNKDFTGKIIHWTDLKY